MIRYITPIDITIFRKQFLVMHGNWQQLKLSQKPFVWQQIFASQASRSLKFEQQAIFVAWIESISNSFKCYFSSIFSKHNDNITKAGFKLMHTSLIHFFVHQFDLIPD